MNDSERVYHFPRDIVPAGIGPIQFWIDGEGVFGDKAGEGPEKFGPRWGALLNELFKLDITGMYADEDYLQIFVNKPTGQQMPAWPQLENKIGDLAQKYLLTG